MPDQENLPNESTSQSQSIFFRFLSKVPSISSPQKLFASLASIKFGVILTLTVCLSVVLNGKSKCFSVLASDLENRTCNTINDTCGMATLNWIAFLSQTVIVGGQPFICNMLMRVHSGVLGGKITYQFCLLMTFGALLTTFVTDPESLFVTDTIIQGLSTAVLLGLVSYKITHTFPEDSDRKQTAILLVEIAPWMGVFLCPLYGYLINQYGWRSTYIFIVLLLMLICVLAGIIDPKPELITNNRSSQNSLNSETDQENIKKTQDTELPNDYRDFWEMEEDAYSTNYNCQHPSVLELLLNANISKILSRPIVILWLIDQAIYIVAEFNLVINIVHYMTSMLQETISYGSLILITLGVGYIMGYITIYTVIDKLKTIYLLRIYTMACILMAITFIVWHIYGSSGLFVAEVFTVPDAHFVVIIIGILSAISNAQSHGLAADIMEKPQIISMSITKIAQALGLLIGPITSGILIQISFFKSFFAVQAAMQISRVILLLVISILKQKLNQSV